MRRTLVPAAVLLLVMTVASASRAMADPAWINDILANPSRYWNTTITVTGQVMTTTPNPAGTARGTYTLLDDSSPVPATVRTRVLPPVGQIFTVTGVVMQDPAQANVPLVREVDRALPGMFPVVKWSLVGGGVLFLVLLVVFMSLLVRPKPRSAALSPTRLSGSVDSMQPLRTASVDDSPAKTTELASGVAGSALTDKTQVFMSLGAEIVVERGPDRGQQFPLHKQVTTIGRPGTRKNDIELNDDTVSKEQASIYFDNASSDFYIKNQSNTNPTRVDRAVVPEQTIMKEDALIEVGKTALRFRRV